MFMHIIHMAHPIPNPSIPARLITIPVSHYCEKTRWALTRSQIPFVEERHMPPFHRFATRRIGRQTESVTEAERQLSPINRFVSQFVGGQSVPVLITETGILNSSEEILKYVDEIASEGSKLYPTNPEYRQQIVELIALFDSVLAPVVRQWFYFYTFDRSQLIQPLWCQGVPWFEQVFFPIVFRWMRSNVFQMYTINIESTILAHERICNIFETVESLLVDGRTYLVGNQFSAADLTFATLAAAVVMPTGYGITLPELNKLPTQMVIDIQAFRETLAGKFVLRLYEEHERIVHR
jgi:glutathione S-transferase